MRGNAWQTRQQDWKKELLQETQRERRRRGCYSSCRAQFSSSLSPFFPAQTCKKRALFSTSFQNGPLFFSLRIRAFEQNSGVANGMLRRWPASSAGFNEWEGMRDGENTFPKVWRDSYSRFCCLIFVPEDESIVRGDNEIPSSHSKVRVCHTPSAENRK